MGIKINIKTRLKMAIAETWINYVPKVQNMIEDLKLEDAWRYFDEDFVCYGPLETDEFRGKETFMKLWTENNEVQKSTKWDEPYMDGEIGVRCGHIDLWHFECRVKTKNNKVLECVCKTIDNPNLIPDFKRF